MSDLTPLAGYEWRGSTPQDHEIPKTIGDVVVLLERRIEAHQAWLDWFESAPKEETDIASREGVGTAAFQRVYIAQYRAAIQIIQNDKDTDGEQ